MVLSARAGNPFLDAIARHPGRAGPYTMTSHLLIYVVFGITYVLISAPRLPGLPIGRPAGAMLGALLMVAVGALTPAESYRAIDSDTLLLLFGMMVLTAYLERAGFFEWLSRGLLARCATPFQLLVLLSLVAGGLAALLVNDTVCLFLTPVVVHACRTAGLPFAPFLIALATSTNIGSAATLVGNPQNMIIGSMSGFPFGRFLLYSGPAALAGLAVNLLLLRLYYRRKLPPTLPVLPPVVERPVNRRELVPALVAAGAILAGFFAGLHLGYTTLAGVTGLILYHRKDAREILGRVDWPLLVFFSGLFIVVAGLASTGIVDRSWRATASYLTLDRATGLAAFSALMTVGSNLVSNVPLVLLAGPHLPSLGAPELGWVLLAFTTTVAGNLTLIGSVANIIVAEGAKQHHALGFWEYCRFGLVSTVLVLVVGVTVIRLLMG